MASRRRNGSTSGSSAVTGSGTILSTAIRVLSYSGNRGMSPREIAKVGVDYALLQVPRGRTQTYLNQLVQSAMYNSVLSDKPLVYRPSPGKYKASSAALKTYG